MRLTDTVEVAMHTAAKRWREAVPAKRYGQLAVHKDIVQGKRQLWRITHVGSGMRVLGELTLKASVAIVKELQVLPEWTEPTLCTDNPDRQILAKLACAVREARDFHTAGGVRLSKEAA